MMTSTERSRARRAKMTPNERTAYQAKYTVKRREDLIRLLAPDCRCAICGEVFDPSDLEIDHVDGITWDHDLSVIAPPCRSVLARVRVRHEAPRVVQVRQPQRRRSMARASPVLRCQRAVVASAHAL